MIPAKIKKKFFWKFSKCRASWDLEYSAWGPIWRRQRSSVLARDRKVGGRRHFVQNHAPPHSHDIHFQLKPSALDIWHGWPNNGPVYWIQMKCQVDTSWNKLEQVNYAKLINSPLKNIDPWKIFTPEKYLPLKNIHPWKIFTPKNA